MSIARIIVSRHSAAVYFISRELGGDVYDCPDGRTELGYRVQVDTGDRRSPAIEVIPIVAEATAEDVRGKIVYGNLPAHLAALAAAVNIIEFVGAPPRGQEYTLNDMDAAGARIRRYGVIVLPNDMTRDEYLNSGGFAI